MSNGIGANPLNAISKVYLDQIAEKKDDSYLEPDMKKRQKNNEKARKDMEKMGTSMKNPHFEEKQQGWDAVNSLADAYKEMHQVDEADSLAAMQARREKRLAAQRKREGTTASGRDFGHDYSLSDKQQKARRDAEFKAGLGTKKEEVEVDEAMSSYDRNRKRAAQRAAERNAARAAGKTGVVPGVGYVSPRKERETYVDSAGTTRHKSGAKMEGLDPVGKEDGDVNNDGKKDSTDSYLMKRRKAIGKAIKSKMSEGVRDMDPEKGTAERKARLEKKRGMKLDDHPQYKKEDVDNVDEMYKGKHGQTEKQYQDSRSDAGKMVSGDSKMSGSAYSSRSMRSTGPNPAGGSKKPEGQGRMTSGARTDLQFRKVALKKKAMKEELSSWRQDLSEIMTDDIDSKPIKEKKNIKNTIKINPKLGESVEELGGEILEMVEVDQFDGIIEEVFQDLLSEGYSEQLVRAAIEEATVTMGHDSYGPQKEAPKAAERTRDKLKKKAKGFLAKVAVKAYNKARDAKAAATPAMQRAKTSAKRGIRKAALKVADKLKEETVDEAVYGGTSPEKKDTRMTVTNADKKANTPAYQKYKAGDKRYKAADHMNEGDGDPCWDTHKQVGMKKKGNRMVPNCVPKNEEVEVSEAVKGQDTEMRKAAAAERSSERSEKGKRVAKSPGRLGPSAGSSYADYQQVSIKAHDKVTKKNKPSVLGMTSEESSMSAQEIALQKRKATIDQMIARKRKQNLDQGQSEQPAKAMGEEASDAMKDRRMERGGVGGNQRYDRAPKASNTAGKKKKYDGMSALDFVKAEIRAKHGKGAIMDTKKK